MDKTSAELPTEILHQILSLLPTKTAARTALLSKSWLKACSTKPHLCFDISDPIEYRAHEFLRIVDNTLERYHRDNNLPISSFELCISFYDHIYCDGLVDKWLDIITDKRASKVSLFVKSKAKEYCERYNLFVHNIFKMKFIQHLELNHCQILLAKRKALFYDDKIKCDNLKNITLCYVTISQLALESLISCCPQIEKVSIQYCVGFNSIRVSKTLPKLVCFSIFCCPIVEVEIVDAPKLLSFEYVNRGDSVPYLSSDNLHICLRIIEIGTCQNLRRVEFVKVTVEYWDLFKIIQKLHSVKELILHYCRYLRKIKISSSTLEVCSIVQCDLVEEAIFDTPKLLSLAFSDQDRLPSLSFERAPSQCRVSINIDILWDVQHLMNLRRFLVELGDQVVDLTLSTFSKSLILPRGIYHLPTLEVEHLELSYSDITTATYSSYNYDVIFAICMPKILTLQCDKKLKKFLRQQWLKKRENRFIKCTWKKYLINAEIEYKKRNGDDWMTLDRKILIADPHIIEEIYTIRFKQIQRNEKNKYSYLPRCIPRWIVH
ncbi:F-box/LRR-repeat protein At4g14096-like [Solanum verrucosum]|uniref:F-box/LRR-repeat protein At4g14096-like n=1 Tax=Solanum verrucosum TaxID=315347 RepID=UPI0020D0E445|nr:F-box/LRR-repeat protein At4g14096-like [Solanum verrucosum]